jgi:prolipoprotein diacylglyceryltransferase
MLPYIAQPQITLFGGFSIHLFGLLVLTGILVGLSLSIRRAREHGISENEIAVPIFLALIFGFLGSHWVEILAYHPERLSTEGWLTLFKVWDGMSSYGGRLRGRGRPLLPLAAPAPLADIRRHLRSGSVGRIHGRAPRVHLRS